MVGVISAPSFLLPPICKFNPKTTILERNPLQFYQILPKFPSALSTLTTQKKKSCWISLTPKASVGSTEYDVEPATSVKFQTALSLPGCSDSLALLGTGYREKVFAIIGLKVYAAGLYINQSILETLNSWKGRSPTQIQEDLTLFSSLFQAPSEKSLQIVLVRDVDGKTFWDALNDAISPRIKEPVPIDESAFSTFRNTFQGRPLKKGTFIFLTWVEPSKMLVSISSSGLPLMVDSTIESLNVSSALFDVFFGDSPVSPTLKASVANGLATLLI